MRVIVILGLFIISFSGFSQEFPSELWHSGKMVLVSEDTLIGLLKYDMEQELVQVKSGEKLYTYGASKVFYFEIFDETVDYQRRFYTIHYGLVSNYKVPVIFEVLLEGNISLLSREKIGLKSSQVNSYSYRYSPSSSYTREILTYSYYFLDRKGNITLYTLKKKDLLTVLSKRETQVSKFIRSNNLNVDHRSDLIRIISFYNGII